MSSFTIEGVLKLTSPLHIASPGKRYVGPGFLRISTERGTPITPTTQYPVALTEDDYLSTDFAAEGGHTDRSRFLFVQRTICEGDSVA